MIVYIVLFLICIMFYIHILYHMKISNEENIYDVDFIDKKNLSEVCDLRQPFLLNIQNDTHISRHDINNTKINMNILQTNEVTVSNKKDSDEKTEKIVNIYSEFNPNIVHSPEILNKISPMDEKLRPDFSILNQHDIIISDRFNTPLTSNYNFRNYFCLSEGSAKMHLISPLYDDSISYNIDYERMQKTSLYNVHKNKTKVKVHTIDIEKGSVVYVPSRWWYCFSFEEPSVVVKYQYRTPMNMIANIPHYLYSFVVVSKAKHENKKKRLKKIN